MMSVTEKQTVDELLQTTRVQIQVMAAEGVQQIVAQHGANNMREVIEKLERQVEAEGAVKNEGN